MKPNREPLVVLLGILFSIAAYVLYSKVILPWRERARFRRHARQNNARLARDVEASRQFFASQKNGRNGRTKRKLGTS